MMPGENTIPFGCWWIDPKTGEKVPGTNPKHEAAKKAAAEEKKPPKKKTAKAAKAEE